MQLIPYTSANLINDGYNKVITPGYDVLGTFPEDFGHILKATDSNIVRLPIPGTKDLSDWEKNSEFRLILTPYGYVHEGFYSDFCLLLPEVINRVSDLMVHGYDYIISGHSLGAPIATLISVALASGIYPTGFDTNLKIPKENIALETFASPYPGNNTFAHFVQCLKLNTLMVINTADLVNYVPKGFGFESIIPAGTRAETIPAYQNGPASMVYNRGTNLLVLEFNYAPDVDLIIPNVLARHSIIDSYAAHTKNIVVNF